MNTSPRTLPVNLAHAIDRAQSGIIYDRTAAVRAASAPVGRII